MILSWWNAKDRAFDIMCKVNLEYIKLIQKENGQNVMHLQMTKALYRCLQLVLLWYNLFHSTLEDMGFVLNKYDPCVANKMINGKQFTIGWWVDDNAMTHVDMEGMNDIIDGIKDKIEKMTITRGDWHTLSLERTSGSLVTGTYTHTYIYIYIIIIIII